MTDPRLAYYGDDVTGSVDVLLQVARRGARGCLFIGTPEASALREAASTHDVVGIAGIARSLDSEALEAEVRPAFEALRAVHPRFVQYKACSTADSSPTTGSLGRVLEVGRAVFGDHPVPMLFAQPDFGRHTVFGHHFAAEAGVVHRLDRQPTMAAHPSTPMDESDLVAHLSRQTRLPLAALHLTSYGTADDLAAALDGGAGTGTPAGILLDALDDGHLTLIGDALSRLPTRGQPRFVLGAGGLNRALFSGHAVSSDSAATFVRTENLRTENLRTESLRTGPVLALSGSRSPQTRRQLRAAHDAGWIVLPLSPDAATPGAAQHLEVIAHLRAGRSVALTSDSTATLDDTGTPATSESTEPFRTAADPLPAIAAAATATARAALSAGATARLIVCGGDTSSRVVRSLSVSRLSIVANPQANVVVLRASSLDPAIDGTDILLKGGQVGDDDLFEMIRTRRIADRG